jgi:hypothetical protein
MTGRRSGLTIVAVGLLLVAAARIVDPGAPPLYDGVVPVEPYLWLNPPPGASGGPQGATADIPAENGASGLVAVATPELQPQAQLFAAPGSLPLLPGAGGVKVSIEPVPPAAEPPDGHIDGNVYRFTVTDDAGNPLSAPLESRVTVVLRSADANLVNGTMERYDGSTWQSFDTSISGSSGAFAAVVTDFGDFAVVAPGPAPTGGSASTAGPGASPGPSGGSPAPSGSSSFDLRLLAVAGLALIAVASIIAALRGRGSSDVSTPAGRSPRTPSPPSAPGERSGRGGRRSRGSRPDKRR